MNPEKEKAFAKFLIEKKAISGEHLKECFQLQKEMQKWEVQKTIDKVIVDKGYVSEADMSNLLREYVGGDEELIPGYRITKKLGEGAMGEVYKATDLEDKKREVAIKILFSHLGKRKGAIQRFMQEAQICINKLNHPNIVKGYDVGYEVNNDCYFYVMELVEGHNLRQLLEKWGPFSEPVAVKIMLQLASALNHAALFNLVHRDIKPDNIILTPDGNVKLCDLGLARDWAVDLSLTRTGAVMGTPFYISPEAAQGQEGLDCRSDIYSLGATMYHMLVGQVPFSGTNSNVVLRRHIVEQLIPPKERREDLAPELSAIIEMMMEKNVDDRYQTPGELIEDLNRFKTGNFPKAYIRKNPGTEEFALEEIEVPEESTLLTSQDIVTIEDVGDRRLDTVEEYLLTKSSEHPYPMLANDNKRAPILNSFFTSAERRVLSKAQKAQSKLLVIGAIAGSLVLAGFFLLLYLLYTLLFQR